MTATPDTARALLTVFAGRQDCYGQGRGLCVKKPVTDELLARHLAGDVAVGIYPLTSDGLCRWLCIDLDYPEDPELTRWTRALTLREALHRLGAAAFVERSKAKGHHVWVFFREPVMAAWARALARQALADAALPSDTEIFPAHDRLTAEVPFGNYMNLPYHGSNGDGKRMMLDPATGEPWTVDEFLAAVSLTDPNDVLLEPEAAASAGLVIEVGGPPAAPLLGEDAPYGQRHNRAKKVIGLLCRRLVADGEDAVLDMAVAWNETRCEPPLPEAEIRGMVTAFWGKEEKQAPDDKGEGVPEPLTVAQVLAAGREGIDYRIESLAPVGTYGLVVGDVGTAKTWMLEDLAVAAASGGDWLGLGEVGPVAVLVVDEESAVPLIGQRIAFLCQGRGIEKAEDLPIYYFIQTGIDLRSERGLAVMEATIARFRPGLVVAETLVRLHSGNENSAQDMSALHRNITHLRGLCDSTWVVSHHETHPTIVKRDRTRGSTDITAYADWKLSASKTLAGYEVRHTKARWTGTLPTRVVRLVAGPDSVRLTAAVTAGGDTESIVAACAEWLVSDWLASGPKSRQETLAAAKELDYGESALDRAVRGLGTIVVKAKEGTKVSYELSANLGDGFDG